jgi:hypothetical protein
MGQACDRVVDAAMLRSAVPPAATMRRIAASARQAAGEGTAGAHAMGTTMRRMNDQRPVNAWPMRD